MQPLASSPARGGEGWGEGCPRRIRLLDEVSDRLTADSGSPSALAAAQPRQATVVSIVLMLAISGLAGLGGEVEAARAADAAPAGTGTDGDWASF